MKRVKLMIIFVLAFLPLLSGCYQGEKRSDFDIFALDREENSIIPMLMHVPESEVGEPCDMATRMILSMSQTPSDKKLRETILGFEVVDYELKDGVLMLNVSEDYLSQQPTTEVLVRAALVRTLCQIEGVDYVGILCNGKDLVDALGQPVGLMEPSQFVDNSGNEINSYERVELALYFADEEGRKLVKSNTTVEYNSNISTERLVVEQIIKGPNGGSLRATVNPQTKINNVSIKDGVCYVNLDGAVINALPGIDLRLSVYSIVNSLTELPGINKVQLLIDGDSNVVLGDDINLENVFERNLDLTVQE